ncbi:MAG: MltA domain-containing protein [Candidatus Thiothrix putei]|uniref:Membrane-bound lytic murein transglycosylase A n=1 Tax=Candidatus Thiothrix putei TaxID=3080811 RepID=A0AA95HD81_9GAMM|nr:MAG: MltA domain-containing protein [Candidatus Thiothrix putei]
MQPRRLATTILMSTLTSVNAPSFADTPIWESWAQPQTQRGEFAPSRTGFMQPRIQLATYSAPAIANSNSPVQAGLRDLANSLRNKKRWERQAPLGANIANKTLQDTIEQLLYWQGDLSPNSLRQRFDLIPIASQKHPQAGDFTGYYTPSLVGSRTRTERFTIPVYRMPKGKASQLSHAQIAQGALASKNLEVAWVDDPYLLYIAQVQGSAQIHFTDGTVSTLDYAGNNGKAFQPVSDYLKAKGYNVGRLTHDNIGRWLNERPAIMREALLHNPRYIFFRETKGLPKTASGASVVPWHTIAVDSRYIPHGSVLLAELPRVNAQGQRTGETEWRLLFAQDHGRAIQGNGRFDVYTGIGDHAESATYSVSGSHRTFLLVSKSG